MFSPRNLLVLSAAGALIAGCASSADSGAPGGNVGFGGAQDIGQFRDILEDGKIPSSNTLDANGFFNEHFAELPPADCGEVLCVHGMLSVNRSWLDESRQTVLRVALNTSINIEDLVAKPLDLIVVVDTSGSMANEGRMSFVKQGLGLMIDGLGESDRLGIVTYSTNGSVEAELGSKSPQELQDIVTGMTAQGSTNIYEGLELGLQMASENSSADRQSRVILLSDGLITAGPSAEDVQSLSEVYIADGIGLTTIGVGSSFNVDLMRGLAERGAGNFYFLEDPSAVVEVFSEELRYFSEAIALNMQLDVQAGSGFRLGEVVGSNLWEGSDTSGSIRLPALFLSSRKDDGPQETGRRGGGSSIYIIMTRTGAALTDSLATLSVSYRLPGSEEIVSQELVVNNVLGDELPTDGFASHIEMIKSYAIYNLYLGFKSAAEQAELDYGCALDIVETISARAMSWNQMVPSADIDADLELLALFKANLVAAGAGQSLCGEGYNDYEYGYSNQPPCSVGGSTTTASVGLSLLLLMVLGRRRRRGNVPVAGE